jgi:hypothetical protein
MGDKAYEYGHVKPGSKEWTLMRPPKKTVTVTAASLENLQTELALLKDVLAAAGLVRDIAVRQAAAAPSPEESVVFRGGRGSAIDLLKAAIWKYEGWAEGSSQAEAIVESLLVMAAELEEHEHG